jgi:hypothetical protein
MASYHSCTETNGVQRSKDLIVNSRELFDPTPSTYPVDWCELGNSGGRLSRDRADYIKDFYEEREG